MTMLKTTRRQHYGYLLVDDHWDKLESISSGNADIIADMLASALCYAENYLNVECQKESQLALLTEVLDSLQYNSPMSTQTIPFSPVHHIATVAVSRYRECVIDALGGNQTPCTLQVSNDTEKSRETQHVYRVPLISRWISNVRRTLRKVAILLGISKFSEEDFL